VPLTGSGTDSPRARASRARRARTNKHHPTTIPHKGEQGTFVVPCTCLFRVRRLGWGIEFNDMSDIAWSGRMRTDATLWPNCFNLPKQIRRVFCRRRVRVRVPRCAAPSSPMVPSAPHPGPPSPPSSRCGIPSFRAELSGLSPLYISNFVWPWLCPHAGPSNPSMPPPLYLSGAECVRGPV
jgi:hypothetical protein